MNINNGKTGNVNIPGALHSTGGDGDGQVGGVVAYAGDVYDETLGKNQKEINQTLLDGSRDSNVIAVALNDLNEKVEEQEKVTSSGLNDLNDKTDNLSKDIEDLEKTASSSLNDLNEKIDNLNEKVDNNEKTTASALTDLDDKVDTNKSAINDLNDLNDNVNSLQETVDELNEKAIKLNEYNEVNITYPIDEEIKDNILCTLVKDNERIIQDHPDKGSEFADYVRSSNFYIATNIGNHNIGLLGDDFGGYELNEQIENFTDSNDKSIIVKCFKSNYDYWIIETESELTASNNLYSALGNYYKQRMITPFRLESDGSLYLMNVGGFVGNNSDVSTIKSLNAVINNHFTDNNSIKVGTAINVSGTDSIAGGAGVSLTGNRTFGYGTSMGAIYLTGDNKNYSARLHSKANYTNANNIGSVFATTHLNSYLLSTSDFSRVAKITNIVYNGENQPLTLTLDTDLGELTNATYAIENVAGTKSFNGGSFGNTGQNSSVIGQNNFNTGNSSNILGSINANTAGTATVLGCLNKNNGANSNVFGSLNDNSGTYGNVIGLQNTNSGQYANIVGRNNNNKCTSANILGIANIVNETTYPSSILGFENNADATTQQFTLGYQNHGTRGQYAQGNVSASFMFGHNLTTSSGCWALGKYNKDYDVQDTTKQNFFVIGQGDTNAPLNSVELKRNGNLYIFNVGGFNGTNSDNANIKPLHTIISELQNTITSLQSRVTALENQLNGGGNS